MSQDKINEIRLKLQNLSEEKVNKNDSRIDELEFEIAGLKDRVYELVCELESLEKEGDLHTRKDLEKELLELEVSNGALRKEKYPVDYFIILSSLFSNNFVVDRYNPDSIYRYVYATEKEIMACNGYMAIFVDLSNTGIRKDTVNSVKFNDETDSFTIISEKPKESHIEYIDKLYKIKKNLFDETVYKKTLLKSEIPIKNRNDKHDYIEFPETKIYFNKDYLKTTILPFNEEDEIEVLYSGPLKAVIFIQNNIKAILLPVMVN